MFSPSGACTCGGQSPRCPACVSEHVRHFGGAAELRGSLWADRIVRKRPDRISVPFPETPKAFGMARKLVNDIAKADDGIGDKLVERVIVGAHGSGASSPNHCCMTRSDPNNRVDHRDASRPTRVVVRASLRLRGRWTRREHRRARPCDTPALTERGTAARRLVGGEECEMASRTLLAIVGSCGFVVGCTGSPAGGGGGGGGGGGADASGGGSGSDTPPAYVSGTRIKVRSTTTTTTSADGASYTLTYFAGWTDSTRGNEACTPTLASDGVMRCMPAGAGPVTNGFADAGCTIPVAAYGIPCGSTATPPAYVSIPPSVTTCPATVGASLYPAGTSYASYYLKSGASCTGPNTVSTLGFIAWSATEIPPSSFAEMTSTTTSTTP